MQRALAGIVPPPPPPPGESPTGPFRLSDAAQTARMLMFFGAPVDALDAAREAVHRQLGRSPVTTGG